VTVAPSRRPAFLLLAALAAASACRTSDIGGNLAGNVVGGAGGGRLASDITRAAVTSFGDVYQQMAVKFSPEQEYFLGRAVAANVIARHGLDPDPRRQDYVRKIGASIVALSDHLRGTYGGYHFAVLADPRPNGVSGPGGFVFVTRGALDLCRNEDEVAGLLAHELAHVHAKHGESIIRTSRQFQTGIAGLGRLAGSASSQGGLAGSGGQFANHVAGLFRDTVSGYVRVLAEEGYGAQFEQQADVDGTRILYDVGYDAGAIQEYVKRLPDRASAGIHGDPAHRAAGLGSVTSSYAGPFDGGVGKAARTARFQSLTGGG
jgi:predicted Zn-dependent protease